MTDIGHNNPPEPTPYERAVEEIDLLYTEAKNWCDGDPVSNQDQANTLSTLIRQIQQAGKAAEKARVDEKKPHLDAGREIEARYKPLKARVEDAIGAARQALKPFLERQEKEKRDKAEAERRAAAAAAAEAAKARESARDSNDLEEIEKAREAEKLAEQAAKTAKKAEKQKAHAKGEGRAIGLRDNWTATISDVRAATAHYWKTDRQEFIDLIQRLANRDVRQGKRTIPGIEARNERKAI